MTGIQLFEYLQDKTSLSIETIKEHFGDSINLKEETSAETMLKDLKRLFETTMKENHGEVNIGDSLFILGVACGKLEMVLEAENKINQVMELQLR